MTDDTLIRVENVSKKFCRSLKRSMWYGVKDLGRELLGGRSQEIHDRLRQDEFWAIRDVSFELNRGECLGLIGRNGAGKTTLLRMLNGLIKPDHGRIEIRGRVGALIALGAGFNPILTGRENIYVNGSVLGLGKREIDTKIDEIIDFAEIREFIDAPVQTYSSGMSVRLGFAIAAILLQPDILFLDEVLAVGDIGFTIKCLNTVRRLTRDAAVVFVSHNMQFVSSFCTRVLVMERGVAQLDSPNPAEGIDRYYAMISHETQISGTGEAEVLGLEFVVNGEALTGAEPIIPQGANVCATLQLYIGGPRTGAYMHIYIMDEAMTPVICLPVQDIGGKMAILPCGTVEMEVPFGVLELASGKYSITVAVSDSETAISLARVQGLSPFRMFAAMAHWGKLVRPALSKIHILDPIYS